MQTHVKVLAVIFIVLGGLCVLGGLFMMLIMGGAAGIVGVSGDPDATTAVPIMAFMGTAFLFFLVAMGAPAIIAGVGLLKFKPWARILTIVICAINLINIPFGTILGAYGLWVLLNNETQRMFDRPQPATTV